MKRISTMLFVLCFTLPAVFAQVQVPLEQGVDGTLTNITPTGVAVTTAEEQRGLRGKNIAVTSQFVFFLANDSSNSGEELWITDGTFANTRMVKDINPGTTGSDPKHLCAVGDTVYFSADNGTDGAELWMSDGTEAGTKMVEDIFIGPGNSSAPDMMVPFKGGVLFRAKDNISAADNDKSYLWWSADGTAANTNVLHPIQPVIVPDGQELTQIQVTGNGEKAFFVGLDDTTGQELWVTWGDSTKLVLDIGFQADTASQVPGKTVDTDIRWLYAVNDDQIWFRPFTPSFWTGDSMIINQFDFLDNEIWVSNGEPWGTYPLGDLNDNPSQDDPRISGNTGAAFPRNFNGRTYFRANDGVTGTEMHSTNLTPGDFPLVQNINGTNNNGVDQNNFLEQFEIFDGFMYFKGLVSVDDSANTGFARVGQELFRVALDPEPRIEFVFDIFAGPTNNSFPREMKTVNNRMYFRANDAPNQS
ncbi:MAG: ELWxxDGT repeat protein, partial [Bacteroidota bacterium]